MEQLATGARGFTLARSAVERRGKRRTLMPADQSAPAVSLRNVAITFGAGSGAYTAVRGIDLEARPGEFIAIVGPTGCGKSTLLNASAGLLKPSEGQVAIFGLSLIHI